MTNLAAVAKDIMCHAAQVATAVLIAVTRIHLITRALFTLKDISQERWFVNARNGTARVTNLVMELASAFTTIIVFGAFAHVSDFPFAIVFHSHAGMAEVLDLILKRRGRRSGSDSNAKSEKEEFHRW